MSRVALLTRPLPVRDGVMDTLQAGSMTVLSLPTLHVSAHIDAAFEAHLLQHNYNGVVCVSQHAVAFVAERLAALNGRFSDDTWFAAVGAASGQALHETWPNARIITPESGDTQDTDGLWRALTRQHLIQPNYKVLIARAQSGRDVLLHRLQDSGVLVDVWPCYRRDEVRWRDDERHTVLEVLNQHGLVLSITSIEGLRSLLRNLAPIPEILWQQPLVTLHPVIAEAARHQGFTHVVCVSPHEMSAALLAQRD